MMREVERTVERSDSDLSRKLRIVRMPATVMEEVALLASAGDLWQVTVERAAEERAWMRDAGVTA